MELKDKKVKRLGIDIPTELAYEIKMFAARRNCTVKRWVLRAIVEYMAKEQRFETNKTSDRR